MSNVTIIEQAEVTRDYGFDGVEAIIEHPALGRLYVADGYGEDRRGNGCVRWEHGRAIRLQPGDTLESLQATDGWNDGTTILEAALHCADPSRQDVKVPGGLTALAAEAGL